MPLAMIGFIGGNAFSYRKWRNDDYDDGDVGDYFNQISVHVSSQTKTKQTSESEKDGETIKRI